MYNYMPCQSNSLNTLILDSWSQCYRSYCKHIHMIELAFFCYISLSVLLIVCRLYSFILFFSLTINDNQHLGVQ